MKIANAFAMMAALTLVSCGSSKVALKQTTTDTPGDELTQQVMRKVNDHRVSLGKKPLKYHSGLSKLAKSHCDYMKANSGNFSLHGKLVTHYGFDGRTFMANKKYRIENVGENVAASYENSGDLADKIFEAWLTSRAHKQNMEQDWSLSGIATSYGSDGKIYMTQMFGTNPAMAQTVGAPSDW